MRPSGKAIIAVIVMVCGVGLALAVPKGDAVEKKKGPPPPPPVRVEKINVPGHLAMPLARSIRMVLGRRADAQDVIVAADPAAECVLVSGPPAVVKALRAVMGPGPYEPPEVMVAPPPKQGERPERGERREREAKSRRRGGGPDEVRIFRLGSLSSQWAVKTLSDTFRGEAGLRIASNAERNAVVLKGEPAMVDAAERLLAALDDGGGKGGPPIHILPVKHANAADVASVMRQFLDAQAAGIGFDARTNAIIIRCDDPTLEQARSLIEGIDIKTEPRHAAPAAKQRPTSRSERKTGDAQPPKEQKKEKTKGKEHRGKDKPEPPGKPPDKESPL
jgi:hypothetical protein